MEQIGMHRASKYELVLKLTPYITKLVRFPQIPSSKELRGLEWIKVKLLYPLYGYKDLSMFSIHQVQPKKVQSWCSQLREPSQHFAAFFVHLWSNHNNHWIVTKHVKILWVVAPRQTRYIFLLYTWKHWLHIYKFKRFWPFFWTHRFMLWQLAFPRGCFEWKIGMCNLIKSWH